MEPNDVDCVLLLRRGRLRERAARRVLAKGLPYLEIAIVRPREFDRMINVYFATDRYGAAKGMVEVIV
ncbi:MAG TPA: hypothetical protein VGM03_21860 [Phycisphaerae bacterium]|jgi:hypothetical protein